MIERQMSFFTNWQRNLADDSTITHKMAVRLTLTVRSLGRSIPILKISSFVAIIILIIVIICILINNKIIITMVTGMNVIVIFETCQP